MCTVAAKTRRRHPSLWSWTYRQYVSLVLFFSGFICLFLNMLRTNLGLLQEEQTFLADEPLLRSTDLLIMLYVSAFKEPFAILATFLTSEEAEALFVCAVLFRFLPSSCLSTFPPSFCY